MNNTDIYTCWAWPQLCGSVNVLFVVYIVVKYKYRVSAPSSQANCITFVHSLCSVVEFINLNAKISLSVIHAFIWMFEFDSNSRDRTANSGIESKCFRKILRTWYREYPTHVYKIRQTIDKANSCAGETSKVCLIWTRNTPGHRLLQRAVEGGRKNGSQIKSSYYIFKE